MKTIVIASGYFNPIHKGHIEYLQKASELGDELMVIVNSDLQVGVKGSKPFMDQSERSAIINAIKGVDGFMIGIDEDGTVCKSIEFLVKSYRDKRYFDSAYEFPEDCEFIFAKGGDRKIGEIPEKKICDFLGVKIVDGLGEKIQSSSELLKKVKQ